MDRKDIPADNLSSLEAGVYYSLMQG